MAAAAGTEVQAAWVAGVESVEAAGGRAAAAVRGTGRGDADPPTC